MTKIVFYVALAWNCRKRVQPQRPVRFLLSLTVSIRCWLYFYGLYYARVPRNDAVTSLLFLHTNFIGNRCDAVKSWSYVLVGCFVGRQAHLTRLWLHSNVSRPIISCEKSNVTTPYRVTRAYSLTTAWTTYCNISSLASEIFNTITIPMCSWNSIA